MIASQNSVLIPARSVALPSGRSQAADPYSTFRSAKFCLPFQFGAKRCHLAKFRADRSNHCGDMADIGIF